MAGPALAPYRTTSEGPRHRHIVMSSTLSAEAADPVGSADRHCGGVEGCEGFAGPYTVSMLPRGCSR
jgi:hypothetical protein